ncbi:hypothetical protein K1719_017578 [Acacia pycnantha]|nr:hypothetical protein K1719_017578 [Acacia pycnantha]
MLHIISHLNYFFDATIAKGADVKLAANWITDDIAAFMKNEKITINEIKLTHEELSELIASIKGGVISGKIGKKIYFICNLSMSGTVKGLIKENDLVQVTDPAEIEKLLQGFLAGQVMKLSKGKANARLLNKILLEKLKSTS